VKKFIFAVIAVIVLAGCAGNKLDKMMPVEKKMQIADDYFEKGKYHKAIPYYTDVAFERNSSFTTKAQMKLADCYFYQDKFIEARYEYEELIRLFHDAEDINMAYFKIGVCYWEESLNPHYTQDETESAIRAFETFIEKFPFDEKKVEAIEYIQKCHYKLLEKKLNNGYAYFKMFDYSAALMYFDEITELGNINDVDRKALYYSARIYIDRQDKENAVKMIDKLNTRYPESKETAKINKLAKKLK